MLSATLASLTSIRILVPPSRNFMLILVVVAKACPVSHASMRPALLCDWTYTLKIPPMTNLLQICQGRDEFSLPVVPPCFVSPHSHGIPTYSRQLTYALRHGILAPCAFPMPSAVHLRNSVLPGSHLSGLSVSAPFALSPLQQFVSSVFPILAQKELFVKVFI